MRFSGPDSSEVRSACARSLGALADVTALGALARATRDPDEKVVFEARKSLQRLLPLVPEQPGLLLGPETSDGLASILDNVQASLTLDILRAIIHAGSSSALESLRSNRRYASSQEARDLWDQAIAVLEQRSSAARQRETLLRPASALGDQLLRPATSSPGETEYLLHASQPDEVLTDKAG